MINPISYLPTIAWRTYFKNVLMVSAETVNDPAIYKLNVLPIDVNESGAPTAQKAVGYYVVDYVGDVYRITEINVDGDSTKIKVADDFRVGISPQTGWQGILFQSADAGKSPYLAPVFSKHLSRTALENLRSRELTILWRTRQKVEFNNTATPSITNYQIDYASHYGEFPDVTLMTYDVAGVEWERQDKPIRNYIGGLLDSIVYDLMEPYSGYIILSR